ncbi:hypothetical protein BD309DRAFT_260959 [Dichomitus squalens]|nr:hypothetical protein BD309DRAFT_260959 [Dichomitus squalens]
MACLRSPSRTQHRDRERRAPGPRAHQALGGSQQDERQGQRLWLVRSLSHRVGRQTDRCRGDRQGQHALIRLHLPKDDDFQAARLAALYMIFDFKHTKPWLCEFCGAPFYASCEADDHV